MGRTTKPELLFLHALPLDGTMWAGQRELLPGRSYAPTLYLLGDTVEEWAAAALKMVEGDRLIVVGCSVGGSCAIEVAVAAPERVAALVLIGTKAAHRPDADLRASALEMLREKGMEEAWRTYWAPLLAASVDRTVASKVKEMALAQTPEAVSRGVTAFHSRPSRADFLSTFSHPVGVVTGDEDVAPGLEESRRLAASAPLGHLHVVAGCGHYVPMERPGEMNSILRAVIATQE